MYQIEKVKVVTFSLGARGTAERAVFILDKMAAEDNVLTSLGVVTANPGQKHRQKKLSGEKNGYKYNIIQT